jgi:heme-degrading monooxygenase HmoA
MLSNMTVCCPYSLVEEKAMLNLRPLDPKVPIFRQVHAEQAPVVLVNLFEVAPQDAPGLLEAWAEDATWMKRQPGFISTQLHEGIGGSATFLNYAVWESVAHFRRAFEHPDFKRSLERYPATTVASPHLFKRVSVPNLCVGP